MFELPRYIGENCATVEEAKEYVASLDVYSQDIKTGEGRYIALQNGIDAVNSRSDMYDLMKKVQYSNYYLDYDECKNNCFDPRSENIGEISRAVYELIMHPEFEDTARSLINEANTEVRSLTREEKQDINVHWESVFTEVVDVNAGEIFVRIYENDDSLYHLDLEKTTKLNSIDEWK